MVLPQFSKLLQRINKYEYGRIKSQGHATGRIKTGLNSKSITLSCFGFMVVLLVMLVHCLSVMAYWDH